jgi:ABC-type branched-subunit amino acid transport system ATPase component/MFS family permease
MSATVHDPATETAEAVELIDTAADRTEEVLRDARRRMGMDLGEDEHVEPLRTILRREKLSPYPLAALCALIVVDQNQGYAFSLLVPEIANALGLGIGGITAMLGLKTATVAIFSLVVASYVQARPRRAMVALAGAIGWTAVTFGSGFVVTVWGLLFVLIVDGMTSGSTQTVHQPLLLDSYPPSARMRILTTYVSADTFGNVLSPIMIFGALFFFDLTWRGVFVALGFISLAGTLFALRLKDPGFGTFDEALISEAVAARTDVEVKISDDDVQLGFFEIARRVALIPTVRRLLFAFGVFGVFLVPLGAILAFVYDEQFGLDPAERAIFFGINSIVSIIGLTIYGKRGEEMFAKDPARFLNITSIALFLALAAILLGAASGNLIVFGALNAIASMCVAPLGPSLGLAMFSVVPSRMRPHLAALMAVFLGVVGGFAGAIFLGGVERRFGLTGALVAMILPAFIGSMLMRSARHTLYRDMEDRIADQVQEEEIAVLQAQGHTLPMLACRGVNFSYGQLQVLFDVDFTVDHGEMVALLGTNGAGKTTLLRVISGTGLPQRGSVRYSGVDITYVDAERRVNLGITQIPGGRGVFGPLSVSENLRLYGFTKGKDKRAIDTAIEECYAAFPRLGDRRNQMAQTLSGGEQQMLALSKALVLKPKLLLIDELSLGLAPVIVGQLIEMVREINKRGTAVVLVEQSVNVALELVDHAYFMEKGQMKFDGPAKELLGRGDLLRAVFLEGADARSTTPTG